MYPDLIVTAQSAALRVWLGTLDAPDLAAPSVLPGWTVAEVVAHLVAVHDGIAALRPVETPGGGHDVPDVLTVADYVAGYARSAARTADLARTIARDTAGDPLGAWDVAADQARRTLGALGAADRLVRSSRGAVLASTYLTTRVIELVVHAGDLGRSLPGRPPPPVLPSAREHVVAALREVLTARDPHPEALAAASHLDAQAFLDLATGRGEVPDGGVPADLAGALPLL